MRSPSSKRATASAGGYGRCAAATASSRSGRPQQRVDYSDGLYFNAGAARIPSSHRLILGLRAQAQRADGDLGQRQPRRRLGLRRQGRSASAGWSTTCTAGLPSCSPKRSTSSALDQEMPKGELEMIRQFLAALRRARRQGRYVPQGEPASLSSRAAMPMRRSRWPRLTLKELLPDFRALGTALPFLFEAYFRHAGADAPAGRRHGSRSPMRSTARSGRSVQLNRPVTAIRRVRQPRPDRAWAGRSRRSTPIIACARFRPICWRGFRAISRRPKSGDEGR